MLRTGRLSISSNIHNSLSMFSLRPTIVSRQGLIFRQGLSIHHFGCAHHATYQSALRRHVSNDVAPPKDKTWFKHARPTRLFESVMGRLPVTNSASRRSRRRSEPPLTTDPHALPDDLSKALRLRLDDCVRSADASGAAAVLAKISAISEHPSAYAFTLAVDAATAAGDLDQAERYIQDMSFPSSSQDPNNTASQQDAVRFSTVKVAMAYAQIGNYEDALRIMKLSSILSLVSESNNRNELIGAIVAVVDDARTDLGRNPGAWGVVVRALCGLGQPRAAVAVADNAVKCGVSVTDGFLQVTLDALRIAGRWQDAVWLFDTSIQKGLKPSERSISSALRALTCRNARKNVDIGQVERVAALAENPSHSMLSNCLVAFSAVGAVEKVEQVFKQLSAYPAGIPPKLCFSARMAAYANHVDLLEDTSLNEVRKEDVYEVINKKAIKCWNDFVHTCRLTDATSDGLTEPDGCDNRTNSQVTSSVCGVEISNVLKNYLRTKVRCFKIEEAVAVLEDVVGTQKMSSSFRIEPAHVATLLGAIELQSDVDMLQRTLNVMSKSDVRHDIRSIAFTVGTFLGDGDLERALRTVREEGHAAVAEAESALSAHLSSKTPPKASSITSHASGRGKIPAKILQTSLRRGSAYKNYFPALLLRRLASLSAAFTDVGIGRVPDVEALIKRLDNWPGAAESSTGEGLNPVIR